MYDLDLLGFKHIIDSKKQYLKELEDFEKGLNDEKEILNKYVEKLRENDLTKFITPKEVVLAVYEPERNEFTQKLNHDFEEILKKIKEKAHLYSYFMYFDNYISKELFKTPELTMFINDENMVEEKAKSYFKILNNFEVGEKVTKIPFTVIPKYDLIKSILETEDITSFKVETINDNMPDDDKSLDIINSLSLKFQNTIYSDVVTKETIWQFIKTYKINNRITKIREDASKKIKGKDIDLIKLENFFIRSIFDKEKMLEEKEKLRLYEDIYMYFMRKQELSQMSLEELSSLFNDNTIDISRDSLIELVLTKEGLNKEGIKKLNDFLVLEEHSFKFSQYTDKQLNMLVAEYRKEQERIRIEKQKLECAKSSLESKIETIKSKDIKEEKCTLQMEKLAKEIKTTPDIQKDKDVSKRLNRLINFIVHHPVRLAFNSSKKYAEFEEDLNILNMNTINTKVNSLIKDIKYIVEFTKKHSFSFKDKSIFSKISSYDFKKFIEIRRKLSTFATNCLGGRKIFLFNTPTNNKNNLEILELEVSKEDALLLGLTTDMIDVVSKEQELTETYEENSHKISYLEDILIPKKRNNINQRSKLSIWNDFSLFKSQGIIRSKNEQTPKILIKNQRELTSLFLMLYVII